MVESDTTLPQKVLHSSKQKLQAVLNLSGTSAERALASSSADFHRLHPAKVSWIEGIRGRGHGHRV